MKAFGGWILTFCLGPLQPDTGTKVRAGGDSNRASMGGRKGKGKIVNKNPRLLPVRGNAFMRNEELKQELSNIEAIKVRSAVSKKSVVGKVTRRASNRIL
jgi:hypothetical protein